MTDDSYMATLDTYDHNYDSHPHPQFMDKGKGEIPVFAILLLAPFIVSAISVTALAGFNYLVVGLGVLCAISYLIIAIRDGFIFPKEVLLFWAYVAWSVFGIFTADVPILFYSKLRTLFQFSVMILIVVHYSKNILNIKVLFWAILIGGAIVAVSAYLSGDYQRSEYTRERVAGLTLNANVFAMILVYSMVILLYFFRTWKSWILKGGIVVILLIIAKLVIASGSRKGFISFLIVLFGWFAFSYGREVLRRPTASVLALVVVLGISFYLFSTLAGTFLEYRFTKAGPGQEGGSVRGRKAMIKVGLDIISSNPVVGVGLDHFRYHSGFETYSHNNYIEVTVNSGLPGGILYYSIFLILFLRLRRLRKLPMPPKQKELLNIAKVFLILRLISDLVIVSYTDKMNWIILAVFIGSSYYIEHQSSRAEHIEYYQDYSMQPPLEIP